MKVFADKVAVITGAASGIGRAIADRCAKEGMKVVLADIEETALAIAENELKSKGATVLAVLTDVSKVKDIEMLAKKTLDAYGAVHLLFNNAGVIGGSTIWESTLADWEWIIGVNLWGVIHGVRVFVPLMLAQETEGHIVNTASVSGLVSGPGNGWGIYRVTKHGVVTLSETLYYELAERGAKLKVSVLCPAAVNTQIMEAERNRPVELHNTEEKMNPKVEQFWQTIRREVQNGLPPQQVADVVFNAIQAEKFYIIIPLEEKQAIQKRMEDILQERNPT
ncbi:MAG: SDR family NAD(P)-dependent oxidoreductase [Candidatus Heimdallarchaeota archaeon]